MTAWRWFGMLMVLAVLPGPCLAGSEVQEERLSPAWDRTDDVYPSANGLHVAWHRLVPDEKGRLVKHQMVRDGVPGPVFDEVQLSTWITRGGRGVEQPGSLDAGHLWYCARRGDKWYVVADETLSSPYDGVWPTRSERAFLAGRGRQKCLLVAQVAGSLFDDIREPVFSPDGKHVAYAARRGKKVLVVGDGLAGAEYDEIGREYFEDTYWDTVRVDGARPSYTARRGRRWVVVVDGLAGPGFDQVYPPTFSADGKRFAYVARRGRQRLVVLDGRPGPEFDDLDQWSPDFSPDGKLATYLGKRDGREIPVVNGMALPPVDRVLYVGEYGTESAFVGFAYVLDEAQYLAVKRKTLYRGRVSPAGWQEQTLGEAPPPGEWPMCTPEDGGHVAWERTVPDPESGQAKRQVLIDGVSGPLFDAVEDLWFDGARLRYLARNGDKWAVVRDKTSGPWYDGIRDVTGNSYVARRGTQRLVVVDGVEGPPFDNVDRPIFGPGGQVAYAARRGDQHMMVLDGQPGPEFHDVAEYEYNPSLFSPDGQWIFYHVRPAKHQMLSVLKKIGAPEIYGAEHPVFSPTGHRVAYLKDGVVVVDGVPGRRFGVADDPFSGGPNADSLEFSADGRRMVYLARQRTDKLVKGPDGFWPLVESCVVVDGQPGPWYERIVTNYPQRVHLGEDNTVTYLAVRDKMLYRVEVPPPAN